MKNVSTNFAIFLWQWRTQQTCHLVGIKLLENRNGFPDVEKNFGW